MTEIGRLDEMIQKDGLGSRLGHYPTLDSALH